MEPAARLIDQRIRDLGGWRGQTLARMRALILEADPELVAFFRGTSLRPFPPGAGKGKDTRYLDLREGDQLDEAQMATWVKQAAALPGWAP